MAKVIVGIHGLGNKPRKDLLQNWWKESMLEGLRNIGEDIDVPKFELVYWSDILHEESLDETLKDEKHPLYLKETYIQSSKKKAEELHPIRRKILDWFDQAADKIFLNNDMSVNYSYITNKLIHNYFKDLEAYYENGKVTINGQTYHARDQIRNRLINILKKYEKDDIFLISHSMGTIIAFDVLTFHLPQLKVQTFSTMGSPLGIPFVRSKIAQEKKLVLNDDVKLKTPRGVKRWYNFSDLEDDVAISYSLKDDFNENKSGVKAIDFIVHNDYEMDNEENHHKSFGYLRTPEFSNVLLEFIQQKDKRFLQKVKDIFGLNKGVKE
jgi:hypothetical protein